MRKRLGDFLPLILVVVGLGILLYPTVSNFLVERNASRVISNYDAAVANLTEDEYAQMLDDAHAYNSKVAALAGVQPIDGSIDVSGISAETLRQEYNGLLNLNGDGMMGYLTIPSLDVTMPIYHTVEEPVLQVGAGHVETSSLPVGGSSTHSVLSGHRGLPSAKLFTELDKLAAGDQFYIRVLNETFAYEVDSILTVLPHETESLAIAEGEDFARWLPVRRMPSTRIGCWCAAMPFLTRNPWTRRWAKRAASSTFRCRMRCLCWRLRS